MTDDSSVAMGTRTSRPSTFILTAMPNADRADSVLDHMPRDIGIEIAWGRKLRRGFRVEAGEALDKRESLFRRHLVKAADARAAGTVLYVHGRPLSCGFDSE